MLIVGLLPLVCFVMRVLCLCVGELFGFDTFSFCYDRGVLLLFVYFEVFGLLCFSLFVCLLVY